MPRSVATLALVLAALAGPFAAAPAEAARLGQPCVMAANGQAQPCPPCPQRAAARPCPTYVRQPSRQECRVSSRQHTANARPCRDERRGGRNDCRRR